MAVNSSSKLEKSSSDERIGMKGAFIDLLTENYSYVDYVEQLLSATYNNEYLDFESYLSFINYNKLISQPKVSVRTIVKSDFHQPTYNVCLPILTIYVV